ncbi:MAG: hypothetical protein V8T10_07720 [Merdibacter sp.]
MTRHLVCGHDFHYGRYGSGQPENADGAQDFAISVIEPITFDGVRISSSRIEQLIKEGKVEMAVAAARPLLLHPRKGGAWLSARATHALSDGEPADG